MPWADKQCPEPPVKSLNQTLSSQVGNMNWFRKYANLTASRFMVLLSTCLLSQRSGVLLLPWPWWQRWRPTIHCSYGMYVGYGSRSRSASHPTARVQPAARSVTLKRYHVLRHPHVHTLDSCTQVFISVIVDNPTLNIKVMWRSKWGAITPQV